MGKRIYFDAFDPFNPSQTRRMWICFDQSDSIRKCLVARFHRMKNIPQITQAPTVVYRGLREGHEDSLCYVGSPDKDWTEEGVEIPAKKGMLFAVYATGIGKVYDWRWEFSHQEHIDHLENFETRFGGVIWPLNQ